MQIIYCLPNTTSVSYLVIFVYKDSMTSSIITIEVLIKNITTRCVDDDVYSGPRYHLRHSVSNRIPSAMMLRPDNARCRCFSPGRRRRCLVDSPDGATWTDDVLEEDFVSAPSIPQVHVPHSALRRQVWQQGHGLHYPRVMSVNYGRDAVKLAQWNDISA